MGESTIGSLVFGAIGAVLGAPFGLSALGWAVGSTLGAYAFAPDAPTLEGPRVNDKRVTTSTYGEPITRVWGRDRMAGQLLWSTGLIEHRKEETQGGKGGPSQTTVTYTYTESFALGICAGPIVGFGRIWADGQLYANLAVGHNSGTMAQFVGSAENGALVDAIAAWGTGGTQPAAIRAYVGDETQLADPVLEAYLGVGEVPGYRGLAYLVFEEMPLEKFGNRRPHIEVEVFAAGTAADVEKIGVVYSKILSTLPTTGTGGSYEQGIVRFGTGVLGDGIEGGVILDPDANDWSPADARVSWPRTLPDADYSTWYPQGKLGEHEIFVARHTSVLGPYYYLEYTVWAFAPDTYVPDFSGVNPASYYPGAATLLESAQGTDFRGCAVANRNRLYIYRYDGASTYTLVVYDQNLNIVHQGAFHADFTAHAWNGWANHFIVEPEERYIWRVDAASKAYLYRVAADYALTFIESRVLNITTQESYVAGPGGVIWSRSGQRISCYSRIQATVPGTVTVGTVVAELCAQVGLEAGDIDVGALTDTIEGYKLGRPSTARAAIEPLMPAFQFDAVESDDKLKFVKRGGSSVASIAAADLGASRGDDRAAPVTVTRIQELELPQQVGVHFIDVNRDYEPGYQYASRVVARGEGELAVQVAVVMSATKARQIADIVLWDRWQARERYQLSTWRKYAHLEPTDVIQATDQDGNTYTLRITSIQYELLGLLQIEGVEEDAAQYSSAAVGEDPDYTAPTLAPHGPTLAVMIDGPILRDVDDDAGFYVALYGPLAGWRAGALYRSKDAGASYQQAAAQTVSTTLAEAESVLAEAPVEVWDRSSTLTVRMRSGTLSSTTEALAQGGANAAFLGVDGRWELINFVNATDNGDGTYTLDTFIRGRRGTEHSTGNHAVGDALVVLSTATVSRALEDSSDLGLDRLYKAVSLGKGLGSAPAEHFTNTGIALKPHAPVHLQGARDGSGNLTITWIRRSRIAPEWRDYVDVPLGEDAELYDVEIMDGANVVRTFSNLTSATASYTAAEQTTDFGAAQSAVSVKVYQRSATVGRGYAGAATV